MTKKSNLTKRRKKKLNFLFVSEEGCIGDLAWRISQEGHRSRYFIEAEYEKDICDGFVKKVENWEEHVDWADIIVFDDVGYGKAANELRKKGKFVIGGTPYTDKLEDNREFGQSELQNVGVKILPHHYFKSFNKAISFVRQNPARYVIKPSGEAQDTKELLFVGQEEDGRDVLQVLRHYKKAWSEKIKTFQIQKYAEGVEVAVGAFFNGKNFVYPINVNFEHKKLFNGNMGPSTGEMGTLMYWSSESYIFNRTLAKMEAKLAESGYVGVIDINCIANHKGVYPLEFTCRFGYPTISIMMEGILSKWGDFMYSLAHQEPVRLRAKRGFQVGVVIAVPPFPFWDIQAFRRYSEDAVVLFKNPDKRGVHLGEVKLKDNDWKLAGHSGYALVITGQGETVELARQQAYTRVRNIMIPNMFYRTDIGLRWYEDSDKLQTFGYFY